MNGMSDKPPIQRLGWRMALFGWVIAVGISKLLRIAKPEPATFILTIALFVLTAWLIGRLRISRRTSGASRPNPPLE
jgi:hypothetical protein